MDNSTIVPLWVGPICKTSTPALLCSHIINIFVVFTCKNCTLVPVKSPKVVFQPSQWVKLDLLTSRMNWFKEERNVLGLSCWLQVHMLEQWIKAELIFVRVSVFLQMERRYQSQLQSMKERLEQSDSTNRSLQNYVQFLKTSYGNVFGDSLLANWLQNSPVRPAFICTWINFVDLLLPSTDFNPRVLYAIYEMYKTF